MPGEECDDERKVMVFFSKQNLNKPLINNNYYRRLKRFSFGFSILLLDQDFLQDDFLWKKIHDIVFIHLSVLCSLLNIIIIITVLGLKK
jgi:hypothetical protein